MKRITLLLFLLLSLTSFAQNTKPLSKKETKEFIEQIKALVSIGDYEAAISLSQEKSTLIEVKNVAKADRAWWESTKDELAERNNTYNNNEALVKAARQLYYNRKYWECNEALNALNLDRSYARISTLNELATLKSNMAPKHEKMVSITEQMPAVIELYQSKDAEQLFWTFFNDIKPNFESSAGDITDYLSPDYRPIIKELIKDYEPQWEAYRKAYYTTVREPSKTIESMLIKKDMGRNNAQKLLDLFNTYQSRIENCRDYPAEQYPVLAQGHRMVLDVLPEIK